MSILENFVQLVLKFKGSKDDALMEVQSFVAQLFCSLFHIGKNQELLIFNQCLKKMDQVLMNLHNYFKGAQFPIEKIFNDKPFLQEGFVSSEDEIEKPQKKIKKRSETFNIKEPTLAVDEKVKLRDEVIQKMTIGYLKDVQHLREMFVRKDLFPNEEIFDVSYYDYTNNLDPIIKSFIYNKILDVTQQFRLQIQKLSQQNQKLLSEMDKLRQLVKKIVGSAEIESQIRAILSIDKDLYRFWRGVQDVIGTQQVFEIFEKRKMGYGIDYVVIDQCISNSQASGRIYAEYKSQLEEQQLKLTEQVGREIVQLRKQIESLSYQIQDHEEEKKTDFLQVKAQIKTGVESIYEIKQNTRINIERIYKMPLISSPIKMLNFGLEGLLKDMHFINGFIWQKLNNQLSHIIQEELNQEIRITNLLIYLVQRIIEFNNQNKSQKINKMNYWKHK